jgi:hypothetical protein
MTEVALAMLHLPVESLARDEVEDEICGENGRLGFRSLA